MTGILTGKYVGDWRLAEDTEILGTVTGNVTVGTGLKLRMRGRIGGDLIVESGARADVTGVVDGAVRNQGGLLDLNGDFRPDQIAVATRPGADSPAANTRPAEVVNLPLREPPPPPAPEPAEASAPAEPVA